MVKYTAGIIFWEDKFRGVGKYYALWRPETGKSLKKVEGNTSEEVEQQLQENSERLFYPTKTGTFSINLKSLSAEMEIVINSVFKVSE